MSFSTAIILGLQQSGRPLASPTWTCSGARWLPTGTRASLSWQTAASLVYLPAAGGCTSSWCECKGILCCRFRTATLILFSLLLVGCCLDVCGMDLVQATFCSKITTQQFWKSCSFEPGAGKSKIEARSPPQQGIGQISIWSWHKLCAWDGARGRRPSLLPTLGFKRWRPESRMRFHSCKPRCLQKRAWCEICLRAFSEQMPTLGKLMPRSIWHPPCFPRWMCGLSPWGIMWRKLECCLAARPCCITAFRFCCSWRHCKRCSRTLRPLAGPSRLSAMSFWGILAAIRGQIGAVTSQSLGAETCWLAGSRPKRWCKIWLAMPWLCQWWWRCCSVLLRLSVGAPRTLSEPRPQRQSRPKRPGKGPGL